jgi:outer membrane lipopolysaccharide assembly protein LptE/RlpB
MSNSVDLATQLIAKEAEKDALVKEINQENQEKLQPVLNEIGSLQLQILEAAKSEVDNPE